MKTATALILLGLLMPLSAAGANPWRSGTAPTASVSSGTWSRPPTPVAAPPAPQPATGQIALQPRSFGDYPPLAGNGSHGRAPSLYAPAAGPQRRQPQRPPNRGPQPSGAGFAPCSCPPPACAGRSGYVRRPGGWGYGGYRPGWGYGGPAGALSYGALSGIGGIGPFGVPGIYGAPGIYGGPPGFGGNYGAGIGAPWGLSPYGLR